MLTIQETHPKYVTDASGKKVAVMLSIKVFEEILEDLEDMAAVIQQRNEPTISHEKILENLKKNEII